MSYLEQIQKSTTPAARRVLIANLFEDGSFLREAATNSDLMTVLIEARAAVPASFVERLESSPAAFLSFLNLCVSQEFSPPETMTLPMLRLATTLADSRSAVRALFLSSRREFLFEHVVLLLNSGLADLASDIVMSNKAYMTAMTLDALVKAETSNESILKAFLAYGPNESNALTKDNIAVRLEHIRDNPITGKEAMNLLSSPDSAGLTGTQRHYLISLSVDAFGWGSVASLDPHELASIFAGGHNISYHTSSSYTIKRWHSLFEHEAFRNIDMQISQAGGVYRRGRGMTFLPVEEPSSPRGAFLHGIYAETISFEDLCRVDVQSMPSAVFDGFFHRLLRRARTPDDIMAASRIILFRTTMVTPALMVGEAQAESTVSSEMWASVVALMPSAHRSAFVRAGVLPPKSKQSRKRKFFAEVLEALVKCDESSFRTYITDEYTLETFCRDSHMASHKGVTDIKGKRLSPIVLTWLNRHEIGLILKTSNLKINDQNWSDLGPPPFRWQLETEADYDLAALIKDDRLLLAWAKEPLRAAEHLIKHDRYEHLDSLMDELLKQDPSLIKSGVYLSLLLKHRPSAGGVQLDSDSVIRFLAQYTRAELSVHTSSFDSSAFIVARGASATIMCEFNNALLTARFSNGEYVVRESELLALLNGKRVYDISNYPVDLLQILDTRESPLSMQIAKAGAAKDAKAFKVLFPEASRRSESANAYYKEYVELRSLTSDQRIERLRALVEGGENISALLKRGHTAQEMTEASKGLALVSESYDDEDLSIVAEILQAGGRVICSRISVDMFTYVGAAKQLDQLLGLKEDFPNSLDVRLFTTHAASRGTDWKHTAALTAKALKAFPLAGLDGEAGLAFAFEVNKTVDIKNYADILIDLHKNVAAIISGKPFHHMNIDMVRFIENELGQARDEAWAVCLINNSFSHDDSEVLAHAIHFAIDLLPTLFLNTERAGEGLSAAKFKAALESYGVTFISEAATELKKIKEVVIAEGIRFSDVDVKKWPDVEKVKFIDFLARKVDRRFLSLNMESVILRDVETISNFDVMSLQFSPLDDVSLSVLFALDQKNAANKYVIDQLRALVRSDRTILPYIFATKTLLQSIASKGITQGELTKIKFTDSKTVTVARTLSAAVDSLAGVASYLASVQGSQSPRLLRGLKRDDLQAFFDKFTSMEDFNDTVLSTAAVLRLISARREFIDSVAGGTADKKWIEGEISILTEASATGDNWDLALNEAKTVLINARSNEGEEGLSDSALAHHPEASKILLVLIHGNLVKELSTFEETFARHVDILEPKILHDRMARLQGSLESLFKNKNLPLGQSHLRPLEKRDLGKDLGYGLYFPKSKADLSELQAKYGWCVGTSHHYGENISKRGNILVCICPKDSVPSKDNALALAHFELQSPGRYRLEQLKGPHNRNMTDQYPHERILEILCEFLSRRDAKAA